NWFGLKNPELEHLMSSDESISSNAQHAPRAIRRAAILFAGGPAPAANAATSTTAASFRRHGTEALAILPSSPPFHDSADNHPMTDGRDYVVHDKTTRNPPRNTRGILIGASRTKPGKHVTAPAHLSDPKRPAQLRTVHRALASLGVDALVSIGGDDTLKSAN